MNPNSNIGSALLGTYILLIISPDFVTFMTAAPFTCATSSCRCDAQQKRSCRNHEGCSAWTRGPDVLGEMTVASRTLLPTAGDSLAKLLLFLSPLPLPNFHWVR